jgi:NADPH:quinone reductase-like Zn-dependent oxidoreductase
MQLAREFTRRMVPLFASGKLRPVVDRIVGFDSVASAHKAMQANENFGKIVLVWR